MNKALADFTQNPLEYDLSEMMDDEEIQEMARDVAVSYTHLICIWSISENSWEESDETDRYLY